MSPRGFLFWKKCVGILKKFVEDKEEDFLKIPVAIAIKGKVPSCGSGRNWPYGES